MHSPWEYVEKYKASKNLEHVHQVALFQWANMAASFGLMAANDRKSYSVANYAKQSFEADRITGNLIWVPQLKYLFAIHNQGHGDAIRGAHAKAEGLKTGVPDICLPVSIDTCYEVFNGNIYRDGRWEHSGLYIELKRPALLTEGKRKAQIVARASGKASTDQERWQEFLRQQGYVCEICYGWEEARDLILRYLKEGALIV